MSSWIVVGDDLSTSMAVYVGALYLLHSGVAASLDFVYWSNHSRMIL